MTDGEDGGAFALSTGTSLEVLRATRLESRVALDHQIDELRETGQRAARTARTALIALGILVSTVGATGPDFVSGLGLLSLVSGIVGTASLLGSVFVGVGISSVSRGRFGIGDSYRREVFAHDFTEREWLRSLLAGYDEWTARMDSEIRRNKRYLLVAQGLLSTGIVCLVVAVGLTIGLL